MRSPTHLISCVRPAKGSSLPSVSLMITLGCAFGTCELAAANGVYRNGVGARAMALGGASIGAPEHPLEAMHANPAGLGLASSTMLQLGAWGALAQGKFSNSNNSEAGVDSAAGAAPELAMVYPFASVPLAIGFGVIPESAAGLDWRLLDAPGGLGGATSYGEQRHFAEYIVVRTALGASWRIAETLTLGASIGLLYNRNQLEAPYTFQSHPALRGFKTLLDLQTDGWGVDGGMGLVWRPHEDLQIGLAYRAPTSFSTEGDASGNAATQLQNLGGAFTGAQPDFHYEAEVETRLPQSIATGFSWRIHDRLRALFQLEWIEWSGAFDYLDIRLSRGNNSDLNGFLGTDEIHDQVPLNWRDRFVYRTGLEFSATDSVALRLGYAYGGSPIPASTITPMSAAILTHTLTAGMGWSGRRFSIDLAYQYDLPVKETVGLSDLRSGEYSGSNLELEAHWVGLTTSIRF